MSCPYNVNTRLGINTRSYLLILIWFGVSPELSHRRGCKVEDQQLCSQDRNSSLVLENPRAKKEQEDFCSSQELEQIIVKEETDPVVLIPVHDENNHSDDIIRYVVGSVESEPDSDSQLFSNTSHVAEIGDQVQEGDVNRVSGSNRDAESKQNKWRRSKCLTKNVNNRTNSYCTDTEKNLSTCHTCGKDFKSNSS